MPISYEIRADLGLVVARYSGRVRLDEVIASFRAFRGDPGFSFALTHLADVSQLTDADAGFSEMFTLYSTFSRAYAAAGAKMRVAIFAPSDLAFGLARIFENLSETSDAIETRVFDDLDAAFDWASLPDTSRPALRGAT